MIDNEWIKKFPENFTDVYDIIGQVHIKMVLRQFRTFQSHNIKAVGVQEEC